MTQLIGIKKINTKNEVLIIILSHNRLDTILGSILSVSNAAKGLADVMISDNSTDKNTPAQIRNQFRDIPLVIQHQADGPIAHLNSAIDIALSSSYKYLTIFHDDDLMHKNFVSKSLEAFHSNKQLVATACNADIEMDGVSKRKSYKNSELFKQLAHVKFLKFYLSLSGHGLAPFPGYMYKISALGENKFDILKGGRHADVSFLNELLKKGDINWRNDVGMVYRVHSGGSGATELIRDRKSQINYAKPFFLSNITSDNLFKAYRSYYIIRRKRLSGHSLINLIINRRYRKLSFYYFLNVIKTRVFKIK